MKSDTIIVYSLPLENYSLYKLFSNDSEYVGDIVDFSCLENRLFFFVTSQ